MINRGKRSDATDGIRPEAMQEHKRFWRRSECLRHSQNGCCQPYCFVEKAGLPSKDLLLSAGKNVERFGR